jgi:hypothetical protein
VGARVYLEGDPFAAIDESPRLVGQQLEKPLIGSIHPFTGEESAGDRASEKIEAEVPLVENELLLLILPTEAETGRALRKNRDAPGMNYLSEYCESVVDMRMAILVIPRKIRRQLLDVDAAPVERRPSENER